MIVGYAQEDHSLFVFPCSIPVVLMCVLLNGELMRITRCN